MNFTHANASLPLANDPALWVSLYLGKPWVSGACGPDAFDCWGLLWAVYREQFGIEIARYPGVAEAGTLETVRRIEGWKDLPEWETLAAPVHGCAVAMSMNLRFHHVGMFLDVDGGLVIHAADGRNVVAESLPRLRQTGIKRQAFFIPRHGQHTFL